MSPRRLIVCDMKALAAVGVLVAAAVSTLAFVGSSSALAKAHGAKIGRGVKAGVPRLGKIIPRRLPPFIAFDWYSASPAGLSRAIFLMNPDGSDPHALSPLPQYASNPSQFSSMPSWSPAATRILVATCCSIWVMGADGSNQRRLTNRNGQATVGQPHWSPDGRRIIYTAFNGGPVGIWIAHADGSHDHRVPNTEGAVDASFSPDGRYILFDAYQQIYVIRPTGRGRRQIYDGPGVAEPSWSPDGRRIIYACSFKYGGSGGVVTFSSTAVCEFSRAHPAPRVLYSNPSGFIDAPTWNADGTKILLTLIDTTGGSSSGPPQVALLAPSGGSPVTITPDGGADPDW